MDDLAGDNGGVYKNYILEDNNTTASPLDGHFENRSRQTGGINTYSYNYSDSESVTTGSSQMQSGITSQGNVSADVDFNATWQTHFTSRKRKNRTHTRAKGKNTITGAVKTSNYFGADCLSDSAFEDKNSTIRNDYTVSCSIPGLPAHTGSDCSVSLSDINRKVSFSEPTCVAFKVACVTSYGNHTCIFKFGELKSPDFGDFDTITNLYRLVNTKKGR